MNSQQQQTHLNNAVSVKVTFISTQENRFVALASPASFAQLVDKTCRAFNVDQATNALHVHYIDDEGDRVSVSSDDELACALLLAAPGRLLRLVVDTTSTAATSTPFDIAPIIAAPVKQEDSSQTSIAIKTDQEDEQEPACSAQQTTGAAALMLKLEAEAGITDIPEKRCARVLARFNGDMDKAADALQRCHERKQLRASTKQKPEEDKLHQREARAEQRQARRNERLAARLARQQSRSAPSADDTDKAPAEVEALVAFMADKGLPAGRGKCVAALRRSGGDVEAAKAALLAWSTKQEQRRQQKAAAGTTIEDAFAAQLAKLHELGFGDDGSDRPNAAERFRRRNQRLLAKFGGDVEQVAQHLTARKAQHQARMAERKERVSREQPVPSELALLLAQLDEKGLGAGEGCDNQRIQKRNLRLLKKLDGDVERVASIIESRQARKQARLARRSATSAC